MTIADSNALSTSDNQIALLRLARDVAQARITLREELDFDAIYHLMKSLQLRMNGIPGTEHLRVELNEASEEYIFAAQDNFISQKSPSEAQHVRALERLDNHLAQIVLSTSQQ